MNSILFAIYFYSHFSVVMEFSFTPNSMTFFFICNRTFVPIISWVVSSTPYII